MSRGWERINAESLVVVSFPPFFFSVFEADLKIYKSSAPGSVIHTQKEASQDSRVA